MIVKHFICPIPSVFIFRIQVSVPVSDRKFLVFKLISHNRYSFENIPIDINKHTVTVYEPKNLARYKYESLALSDWLVDLQLFAYF